MRIVKIALWTLLVIILFLTAFLIARGATNIDPVNSFSWGDISGWWDFYGTNTVNVHGTFLEGYASSSMGDISLDCATSRSGNICASSNYGVCNGPGPHLTDGSCPSGDASGILTGWAWNDQIGWISFNCDETSHGGANTCASSNYKVTINSNGDFQGYAWNDIEGWISFNCANNSGCGASNYKVTTLWQATSSVGYIESSILDTQDTDGALVNSVIWQGTQPAGTSVDFQIAVSNNSNGPWIYKGPGGNASLYYGAQCPVAGISSPGAGPNKPICIDKSQVINFRYMRYRARLQSNSTQTLAPHVDDIILNWSQ